MGVRKIEQSTSDGEIWNLNAVNADEMIHHDTSQKCMCILHVFKLEYQFSSRCCLPQNVKISAGDSPSADVSVYML